MIMMSSDGTHTPPDSHTPIPLLISDQHDECQPLPLLSNFKLSERQDKHEGSLANPLFDGHLQPVDACEPKERDREITQATATSPVKQRAPPPPPLKLTIPGHFHSRNEWHLASQSPASSGGNAATLIQSDYSGVGAGYFSPPQSPVASPSTPAPPSQATSTSLVEKARSRARSVANGELLKLSTLKNRGVPRMVKERRSLQSLFMPSFLQPQTTPLGLIPGPRTEARSVPVQGAASSANTGSGAPSNTGASGNRSERRRSFYNRRRSHTYSGIDNALASPSQDSSPTRVPPMPEDCLALVSGPTPAGRESPSSYLLDEDPFAVSSPPLVMPPAGFQTQSPLYTPMTSPACSTTHSRSPSTVSLSSASSTSMPGTPVYQYHPFGALPEEVEDEEQPSSSLASHPDSGTFSSSAPVPSAPPPTPASPLNPNLNFTVGSNERARSKERMIRTLSAVPVSSPVSPKSGSLSPSSPSNGSGVASVLHIPSVRIRPAHTRPAFASRPSLPSLSTLSRMGAAAGELTSSLRGRKRRGKVGAGLPAEPWDMPPPEPEAGWQIEQNEDEEQAAREAIQANDEGSRKECQGATAVADEEREEHEMSITQENSSSLETSCPLGIAPVTQSSEAKAVSPSDTNSVDDVGTPKVLPSDTVPLTDEKLKVDIAELNLQRPETEESDSSLGPPIRSEVDAGNVEAVSENAHGEGGRSIDAELSYMSRPGVLSESVEDANGESAETTAMLATCSDNAPLSGTHKEYNATCTEREADQDVERLIGEYSSLTAAPSGDDSGDGDGFQRTETIRGEPTAASGHVGSCPVTIPGRASAVPKHILRAFTPYPFVVPRSTSPASSTSSCSPESSVEDFGVLLSSSPAFRGDQRPDSLAIDPGLPDAFTYTENCDYIETISSENHHLNSIDGASPSSLSPSRFTGGTPWLPSSIAPERADQEVETAAETSVPDINSCSVSDADFAPETEFSAESRTNTTDATLRVSLRTRQPSPLFSPTTTSSQSEGLEHARSRSPFREDESPVDYLSSSEYRSSCPWQEDSTNYPVDGCDHDYDHRQYGYEPEADDSSMLPPLSSLPEEDPVFPLSPARTREQYETNRFGSLSSRSVSRKASVASIASIFSMRSGSSGCASQNLRVYSRTLSPSASLSTTLPISNSHAGSGAGLLSGKRVYGSSFGSMDSGHGRALSSSVSSLRSKSSYDLRSLANVRRQGSQSSGSSMLSHSSTRTKFDPSSLGHARKESDAEDVTLGLRAYAGSPYSVAVQAELEGKAGKYEHPSSARYGDDELVLDIQREDVAPVAGNILLSEWNPYESKEAASDSFEPGSSAGTLRPSVQDQETERTGTRSASHAKNQPVRNEASASMGGRTNASGYEYSGNQDGGKAWGDTGGYGNGFGNGGSAGDYFGTYRGGGRRGRDSSRDDDEQRPSRRPSAYDLPTSSESESESESDSDSDVYGEPSPGNTRSAVQSSAVQTAPLPMVAKEEIPIFNQLRNGRKGVYKPPPPISTTDKRGRSHTPAAEDDDVPLAQRIPGALQAQKSIRQQVKSEHDRRRRDRSVAPTPRTSRAPEGTISPPPQHVPSTNHDERGRTLTTRIPRSAPLGAGAGQLSSSQEAAMIAQRLMQPHHATHAVRRPRAKTLSGADRPGVPPDDLAKRLLKVQARNADAQIPEQRASAASASIQYADNKSPVERSIGPHTRMLHGAASPQHVPQQTQQVPPDVSVPTRTIRPMRSFQGVTPEPDASASAPIPPVTAASLRRRSPSRARQAHDTSNAASALMRNRSIKGARQSDKIARRSEEEARLLAAHPPSLVHASSRGPSPPAPVDRRNLVQLRVYLSDMQRFNVVEAGLDTSAKDVLEMLRQQGDLRSEERRLSSWMLYEVCHDFGMERPVRSFELVADISGSWNKEKTLNCFMVKPSAFAQHLASIPSSIPTRSGFVDYESKKGKWNKRWLELREHGLWISKREGKDDEFLCSLSAFDAYIVTRIHKATKNFTFAVKSTDPITLFENKADYLHVFSVPEETGLAWVEAIWLARSYILYQEKNVLFRNKGESANAGANLARSVTRKKPAQTYITLPENKNPTASSATGPFEPGSLLAKRVVT